MAAAVVEATSTKPVAWRGAVVLLDALGVRDRDLGGAREFIRHRNAVLRKMSNWDKFVRMAEPFSKLEFETKSFGDTLILTAGVRLSPRDANERWHNRMALDAAVSMANECVASGISEGILFRGAIASGDYLTAESTILGPAVSDAASWYDRPELIGVILTPTTFLRNGTTADGFWHEYAVPIKGRDGTSRPVKLAMVEWPWPLLVDGADYDGVVRQTEEALSTHTIPFGVELKAENTLTYLRSSRERFEAQKANFDAEYARMFGKAK